MKLRSQKVCSIVKMRESHMERIFKSRTKKKAKTKQNHRTEWDKDTSSKNCSRLPPRDRGANCYSENRRQAANFEIQAWFTTSCPEQAVLQTCKLSSESKSKVRHSRSKAIVAKVSTSASTSGVSPDVAELKDMVRALLLDKQTSLFQRPLRKSRLEQTLKFMENLLESPLRLANWALADGCLPARQMSLWLARGSVMCRRVGKPFYFPVEFCAGLVLTHWMPDRLNETVPLNFRGLRPFSRTAELNVIREKDWTPGVSADDTLYTLVKAEVPADVPCETLRICSLDCRDTVLPTLSELRNSSYAAWTDFSAVYPLATLRECAFLEGQGLTNKWYQSLIALRELECLWEEKERFSLSVKLLMEASVYGCYTQRSTFRDGVHGLAPVNTGSVSKERKWWVLRSCDEQKEVVIVQYSIDPKYDREEDASIYCSISGTSWAYLVRASPPLSRSAQTATPGPSHEIALPLYLWWMDWQSVARTDDRQCRRWSGVYG
ncbi:hypothetical protein Tco_1219801 [Tanacetum coccineum]